ncbi:hypothetical protein CHU95_11715 [Niveispirillum lacus]|uniref:Uncharacterized protein n=1 Tax=Niveispirillum lacus TaxID=1981099 RepID=A0A255YY08_9PROT|nr:hypothetical protein [Niveispirillum lacus]OYQ34123.1 hypothetical protein CHU95_11715 [Niveispirillum lacus]
MITLKPGGLAWLLRHELRMTLRTKKTGPWAWAILIVGILFMHGIGALSVFGFSKLRLAPENLHLIFGGMGLLSVAIMLAASLQMTVNAIYTRGDLDLLLSSPIRPGTIVPVRLLAVGLAVMLSSLAMAACFMNPGAVMVSARWLVGYVTLPALCLLAVTVSFLLVLGLVKLVGARRARTAAQVLGGVIGISAALAAQIPNMNNSADKATQAQNFQAMAALGEHPAMAPVQWLGAALTGEPLPFLVLLLVSLGGFTVVTMALGPAFVRSVNAAAGTDSSPRRQQADQRPFAMRLRGITGTVLWKEWRLILRDPSLLTQVFSILLVAAPVVLPSVGKHISTASGEQMAFGWMGVVPVAGLLAGALVWLAFAGEDAPDLLGTAPVPARRMLRDRLLAAALPAIVPASALCFYVSLSTPWSGLLLWLIMLLSVTTYLAMDMRQSPVLGGRKAFQKRYQGNLIALFGEMLLGFALFGLGWFILKFLAPFWAVPLLLLLNAGALVVLLWPKRNNA